MTAPDIHSITSAPARAVRTFFFSLSCILLGSPAAVGDVEASLRRGERAFERCTHCHTITKGGEHLVGPNLFDIYGRKIAGLPDYSYSDGLRAKQGVWDDRALNRYIARPKLAVPDNAMPFLGMTSPHARADLIAWLKTNPGKDGATSVNVDEVFQRRLVDRGAQLARACVVCHSIGKDEGNRIGPNLWGVVGRPIAGVADFDYSERLMRREGIWTPRTLNDFFIETKVFDQGSHRAFLGLARSEDREALISWLATLANDTSAKAR